MTSCTPLAIHCIYSIVHTRQPLHFPTRHSTMEPEPEPIMARLQPFYLHFNGWEPEDDHLLLEFMEIEKYIAEKQAGRLISRAHSSKKFMQRSEMSSPPGMNPTLWVRALSSWDKGISPSFISCTNKGWSGSLAGTTWRQRTLYGVKWWRLVVLTYLPKFLSQHCNICRLFYAGRWVRNCLLCKRRARVR